MYYQNYHKHTSLSHRYNKDSALTPNDYFEYMLPLAKQGIPQIYSTVEHAWQSDYFKIYDDLEKFNKKNNTNIKFIFGTEAYWVKDHKEKDSSNCHIVLLAKNDKGRKALNYAIAKSYITQKSLDDGMAYKMFPEIPQDEKPYYYYKNRMDLDLLLSLPKEDIFVTTACVAFWNKYSNNFTNWEELDNIVLKLNNHFNDFYLEVQANNTDWQKTINQHIIELHEKYNIPIIAGTDSHYLVEEGREDREYLLASNAINYPEEDGNYMDFPSYEVFKQRFIDQNVLPEKYIIEAIENTNKILDFEDIVLDRSLKVPVLPQYKNKTQEERNEILKKILVDEWIKQYHDLNLDKLEEYKQEVQNNYNEIVKCDMADYFIDNYYIVKEGIKLGGIITPSGRGSGVSEYINKLLGFTKVDKVNAPVKMYAERFITATRILESKTPPDIDNNITDREPFLEAQRKLLGYQGNFDLLALGTLKYKSAFKMFARANNLDPQLANEVTKQIDKYEKAIKHMDDDETEDDYNIFDYVDEKKYGHLINGCQKYRGIVDTLKSHPCASIMLDTNAIEDVGVILVKSESTGRECWVALQESSTMDAFGYVKNDWLIVDSIGLTYNIYKELNIEPFTVNQLLKKIEGNQKVWDIYAKGLTMCINQVEKKKSTEKVMRFKPKNIYELTQFVAGIRPSFQSMYKIFESRQHFDYGIKAFDDLLQDEYCDSSFILYQESLMKVLSFAGFPMSETYTIIKAISKKKKYVIDGAKEKFIPNFTKAILNTKETEDEQVAKQMAEKVWTIIESSASYGFNCLSGKTKLYRDQNGKYVPTIEEMYNIMNDRKYAVKSGHLPLYSKYKKNGYGTCYSLGTDGRIHSNKIIDIYKQPKALTYKITTKTGREIVATANHKFPTDEKGNTKVLSELKVGDKLIVKGQYEITKETYNLTNGDFESNIPKKGEMGFQKRENGAFVTYDRFRLEQATNRNCCEDCGIKYDKTKRFEVHHVDFDRLHNEPSNYAWLCASCHKKRHFKHGRSAKWDKGCPIEYDEIISIEENEVEDVYDVSVSGDVSHTFLIDNGIMTSNCSHAYCMAIDSVTLAYLKAYHPYEFYKVTLQRYTEKGDKNKVTDLKKEMLKMGIQLKPIKFRDDNRTFSIMERNGKKYISQTMSSIKNMQKFAPSVLYELKDKEYNNFFDVLIDLKSGGINKTSIEILIKLNYFREFGNINKLFFMWQLFNRYYGKKQINKKTMAEYTEFEQEAIKKFSGKECASIYKELDSKALLDYLADHIKLKDLSEEEKACIECKYLGYTDICVSNSPYSVCNGLEVNQYGTTFISLYNLNNGSTTEYKANKQWVKQYPLQVGDLVRPLFKTKPRMVYNAETKKYDKTGETYEELNSYSYQRTRF